MNKCVQFILPSGTGGMAAQMYAYKITNQLKILLSEKKISGYKITHEKHYKLNVWLKEEKDITTMLLVWDTLKNYKKPYIVEKSIKENPYNYE